MSRMVAAMALVALAGCAPVATRPQAPAATAAVPPAAQPGPPAGPQYLYGSGEALAISRQAYAALLDHDRRQVAAYRAGGASQETAILAPDATATRPERLRCQGRPLAAVFDMDETAVLNLGYEEQEQRRGGGFDQQRWDRWETSGQGAIVAVPGAVETFDALRALGVTIIVNTNRNASSASAAEAALAEAGLGHFRHGETLWMRGDADGKEGKDGRRAVIAASYCVISLAGDQLGDFTDLFAGLPPQVRRTMADTAPLSALWGHGWFVLPNPVYGAGLRGGWDDVFPPARRWRDPGATAPR